MKNHREKLHLLLHQPRWKVDLFVLLIHALLLFRHLRDLYRYINFNFPDLRRPFAWRTLPRAHYVGAHISQPHRITFILFAIVLLAGTLSVPEPRNALAWIMAWGGSVSFFVIAQSARRILRVLVK